MKRLSVVLMLCLMAVGAFALDLGVNVGGRFDTCTTTMTATVLSKTVTTEQNRQDLDFRFGLVMTPAPWLQLGVDYFATGDKGGYTKIGSGSSTSKTIQDPDKRSLTFVAIEGLFRIPMRSGGLRLSPMIGAEYDLCIGATNSSGTVLAASDIKDADGNDAGFGYYSKFFLKAGVSADFPLSRQVSLRPWLLAGYGLLSARDADNKAAALSSYSLLDISVEAGMGLSFRL